MMQVLETWLMFFVMTVSTDTSQSQEQAWHGGLMNSDALCSYTMIMSFGRATNSKASQCSCVQCQQSASLVGI